MPRAAPRWPLLLLLLLLLLLPPPLAHGAPARPGGRRPASALVVPKRLQSIAGEVALHLSAFGRDLELRLEPDDSFLAPEFKIARLGGSSGAAGSERELRGCIFSGTVNRDPASLAAVSLCRGLSGTFLLEGQEFTIKPQGAGRSLHQPHLLQRWGHVHPATAAQSLSRASEREAQKGEGERQERRADTAEEEEKEKQEDDEEGQEEEAESSSEPPPTLEAKSRTKRFVSEDRFVEMLLVADASMVAFYGEDLESHILMLMSMAARIYKHPSIGNSVNLVMIKLVIMGDEKLGPEVSDNSGLILRDFCAWQRDVNQPRDRHPEHFDTAVLLTRENLCGQEGRCDTLGVANVGTICEPSKSCAVIQDQGLQAAYTLAHELGHVLGMPHDDSKLCTRLFGPLDKHHMMAPLYVQLNKTRPWSPCSASFLREFLDRGYGDCLLDAPSWAMALPTDLPGRRALYDLDQQCKQIFGLGFRHCPNSSDQNTCAQLWCRIDGPDPLCHTRNASLPWADGTPCGPGHLCWEGSCLPKEEVEKPEAVVDGGWAPWGPWGACSRTCGGGVQFSYRECTNPEPQNGGKYCLGQRAKYQSCHTEECPPDGKSFREQQCEKFNAYNYTDVEGNLLQWVPKYAGVSPRDRCKLFCLARGRSEFRMFEDKVIDGTLCGPDTLAICVRGQCVKAGCDHVLDSPKKLDKCGVCGGKGDSCRKVSGSFSPSRVVVRGQEVGEHMAQSDRQRGRRRPRAQGCIIFESVSSRSALSNWDPCQKQLLQAYCGEDISPVPGGSCPFCSYGYNDIVTFPAGSTNIDVKQRSPPGVQNDGNYLALKTTDGEYLLNGNNAIFPTEQYILLNGTVLRYSGAFTSLERLQSFQSLPQPLTLQLLKVHGDPLKVKYTFFVPDDVYSSKQSSRERTTTNVIQALLSTQWVLGAWSECSHSCGAGWQRRAVQCRDPSGQTSAACDEALKPEDTKLCRSLPCFS